MSELDYVPAAIPDDCVQRISPSSFATFIDRPWNWYRQQILKLDVFEYSSASVLGTVVHYCAEKVGNDEEVDEVAIEAYIAKHDETETYCADDVRKNWYEMAAVLINGYVMQERESYIGIEEQVCASIGSNIYVAGTLDVLQGTKDDATLTDYKTYSSKTQPKSIPANYRYQLLTYVWALRQKGIIVTRIRLVYVNRRIDGGISDKTGKPLKSYPPEVTQLTEVVTEDDLAFIESMLMLCKDTLLAGKKHPELAHVIYHDPRLKEK